MRIDVIVPLTRKRNVQRLLYSFGCNTTPPDAITLVNNELVAADLPAYGLPVRVLRFHSSHYAIGELDVALRRNVGIWASDATHVITFDDDQLAPPDLIETATVLFRTERYFWGHHRYIDFTQLSVDDILRSGAEAGRPRELPPNAWHSFRSAYAGLFGADRSLLVQLGGFDMSFSGRHGGEDQDLGRRLSTFSGDDGAVFVREPPFAWHPEGTANWDTDSFSNACSGYHDMVTDPRDGIARCRNCPFFRVPDTLLLENALAVRDEFDPSKVQWSYDRVPRRGPVSKPSAVLGRLTATNLETLEIRLREPYDDYTRNVSPTDMAISLRAAAFLWGLCEIVAPATVLDLGSGFSSFVFRAYAASRPSVTVWTSDTDASWLGRTAEFIGQRGLPSQHLIPFAQLHARATPHSFDFVFHDLGSMATRLETLLDAASFCNADACLVLDDMHKEEYAPHADRMLRMNGWSWRTTRAYTLDSFGRFCGLAFRTERSIESAFNRLAPGPSALEPSAFEGA